jgi:hypothetical protein
MPQRKRKDWKQLLSNEPLASPAFASVHPPSLSDERMKTMVRHLTRDGYSAFGIIVEPETTIERAETLAGKIVELLADKGLYFDYNGMQVVSEREDFSGKKKIVFGTTRHYPDDGLAFDGTFKEIRKATEHQREMQAGSSPEVG